MCNLKQDILKRQFNKAFLFTGSLRARVQFNKALPADLTLLVIGEFNATLTLDKNRVATPSFSTT